MTILAIDPGGITGVAFYGDTFSAAELEGSFVSQCYELDGIFAAGTLTHIVCETYVITQRTAQLSQQHEALKLIGHVEYLCNKYAWPLTMQSPAQAKSFSSDSKLKAVSYFMKTPGGHALDAARHLLRFQAAHGLLDAATLDLLESV